MRLIDYLYVVLIVIALGLVAFKGLEKAITGTTHETAKTIVGIH